MHTISELSALIQTAIETIDYPAGVPTLFDPVRYTLQAGGKRLRPTLVLLAADLYDADLNQAITPAVGLEMYHNFTLLHDDVMDRAEERRGRPTVHVRWDENTAILSGDAMQGLAYQLIATAPAPCLKQVLDLFTQTNIEICEGQQLDMEFETRSEVSTEEYIQMIRLKTAVLLGCALKMGALIAGAPQAEAQALYAFGENLGLAFQLQDDWLDCWGDPKTFGKRIGGDILNDKKTFLLIHTLRHATEQDRATLLRELSPATAVLDEGDKIELFCDCYRKSGAEAACRDLIRDYHCHAMQALESLSVPADRLASLQAIADKLLVRNS
jgi:geranylgeranyl diphosphate synthase type II